MIYPIYLYGSSVLRKEAQEVPRDYPELGQLVSDMFDTMQNADGVGLAAPQIGFSLRLFTIDLTPYQDEYEPGHQMRYVFINPEIYERSGEPEPYLEGCLSVPGINEDVLRPPKIKIRYHDENWQLHDVEFDDTMARVTQHEYDHIEGKVFVDYLTPLRKTLLKSKLASMMKGKTSAHYRCKSDPK